MRRADFTGQRTCRSCVSRSTGHAFLCGAGMCAPTDRDPPNTTTFKVEDAVVALAVDDDDDGCNNLRNTRRMRYSLSKPWRLRLATV